MIPIKFAAIGGAVALALGAGIGAKLHDALVHQPHLKRDAAAYTRSTEALRRIDAAGVEFGLAARDALDKRQTDIRTVTTTILKEVPRYVASTIQCPPAQPGSSEPPRLAVADVSVGFGLLHNYAAAGIAPPAAPTAGIELSAPAGVGMPEAARTVVSNYGQCHAAIAEVAAWRAWDRDVLRPWWARANDELAKAGRR